LPIGIVGVFASHPAFAQAGASDPTEVAWRQDQLAGFVSAVDTARMWSLCAGAFGLLLGIGLIYLLATRFPARGGWQALVAVVIALSATAGTTKALMAPILSTEPASDPTAVNLSNIIGLEPAVRADRANLESAAKLGSDVAKLYGRALDWTGTNSRSFLQVVLQNTGIVFVVSVGCLAALSLLTRRRIKGEQS